MSSTNSPPLPDRKPCDRPSCESTASFWLSEPSPLLTAHRSTRDLPETADVVVIGSGMTGVSVAYNLLAKSDEDQQEKSVVMLEAREACWGATGRNGGHCLPIVFKHLDEPSIGRFELSNLAEVREMIRTKSIACEFVEQPALIAVYTRRQLDELEFALMTLEEIAPDLASKVRLITSPEELTNLRIPDALAAIVQYPAARFWPYKFVARILEDLVKAVDLCGTFNLQTLTPVVRILRPEGFDTTTVITRRGAIRAKKIVLATNAYSSHLLPSFADLIVPCRGQMSALIPAAGVAGKNRLKTSLCLWGEGEDDYCIQRSNERGGQLMFGGGRSNLPCMGVTDDSKVDEPTASYLRRHLLDVLKLPVAGKTPLPTGSSPTKNPNTLGHHLPEMIATHMWTGIMGFSRDERPWVGAVPGLDGIYMSAGYTGHGMPNAWLCGKTVAILVEKSLAGFDEILAMDQACTATQLPKSYRMTKERVEAANKLESVEENEMAEERRRKMSNRPASGYA